MLCPVEIVERPSHGIASNKLVLIDQGLKEASADNLEFVNNVARLCLSMTYSHGVMGCFTLFQDILFPICSRFVPACVPRFVSSPFLKRQRGPRLQRRSNRSEEMSSSFAWDLYFLDIDRSIAAVRGHFVLTALAIVS